MHRTTTATILAGLGLAFAVAGCKQTPQRVDPSGNEAIVTMGMDYADAKEIATNMASQLLQSPKISAYQVSGKPILARYNPTLNKTSMPDREIPVEVMSTAIRSRLISSGQMELTAALQTAEGSDASVREARELANDPMFDPASVQATGPMGTVEAPQLSINSELLSVYAANSQQKQRTFELRVFVVDLRTGRTIWESQSSPIAKRGQN